MNLIGTKVITLDRIYLRQFNMNDVDDLFEYASNKDITKYLTRNPHKNKEETRLLLQKQFSKYDESTFRWAIVFKENNKLIGSIDVVRLDKVNETAEIGYVLNSAYHNQGIMSEAFKGVINYLFNEVNLKEICACFELGNEASKHVMEKCGLKSKNLIKEIVLPLKNNKITYVSYYSIKKHETY